MVNSGGTHLALEESDPVEVIEKIRPFWITGRVCAKMSDGFISDEWPPEGEVS